MQVPKVTMRGSANVSLMLRHCLPRRPGIKSTLAQLLVFAGYTCVLFETNTCAKFAHVLKMKS